MIVPYHTAPNNFGDTWQRYIERGCPPGGFGRALLCNNLIGAVRRADPDNKRLISDHIEWLWEYLPYESWGDEEIYARMISQGGMNDVYPALRLVACNE